MTTDKYMIYFLISINGNFSYRLLMLKEIEGIYLLTFIDHRKY